MYSNLTCGVMMLLMHLFLIKIILKYSKYLEIIMMYILFFVNEAMWHNISYTKISVKYLTVYNAFISSVTPMPVLVGVWQLASCYVMVTLTFIWLPRLFKPV